MRTFKNWKILEMGYLRIQPAVMDEVMCLGPKFYPPSYDHSSYVSYQFLHLLGIYVLALNRVT